MIATRPTQFRKKTVAVAPAVLSATTAGDEEEEARYRPIDLTLVRRMLGTLRPYRRQYLLGVSLGMIQVVLEMQSPRFTQAIIDHCNAWLQRTTAGSGGEGTSAIARLAASIQRAIGFGFPLAAERSAIATIVFIVALWGLVVISSVFLQRWTILIMTGAGERVQFSLRRRLFEQLQRLSMSFYDKTKLGRIISRCTSDIASLREVNVWGMHTIVSNAMMIVIASIMLATTDIRLFLAVAPLGLLLFWVNRLYLKRAAGMWQIAREGYTRVATNMAENITGMRVVSAFSRQTPNLEAFNRLQDDNTSNNIRTSA